MGLLPGGDAAAKVFPNSLGEIARESSVPTLSLLAPIGWKTAFIALLCYALLAL